MLTQGRSLSGHERNCCYLNTEGTRFANVSAASGFDFDSDTRGLAIVDWDNDGDLDVWLSNRTSPRLRFLRNDCKSDPTPEPTQGEHWITIRLEGTSCNRDAIGARVRVHTGGEANETAMRTLRAGEGYLSQASKTLHFGLGSASLIAELEIKWPDGTEERFSNLAVNRHVAIVQGTGVAKQWTRPESATGVLANTRVQYDEPSVNSYRIVPHRRLPIPKLEFTDERGVTRTITSTKGSPVLVVVWATWCEPCLKELRTLAAHRNELNAKGVTITTLCVDSGSDRLPFATLCDIDEPWKGGLATASTTTKLDILQRMLVSRESDLSIPMSLLLDGKGQLAAIYKGMTPIATIVNDAALFGRPETDPRVAPVPMRGRWFVNPVPPDLMSMIQKLAAADLHLDALDYLDRHLRPTLEVASTEFEPQIWSSSAIANTYLQVGMELAKYQPRTDAEAAFDSAIDLAPDLLIARAALANLLQIDGRVPEAIAQYKEMRKRQPNNPAILNDLAWLMASSDDPQIRNPTEAINLASKACELTNHRIASVLDTLATAFASAGRFDEAVETIQKALALSTAASAKPSAIQLREKLRRYESAARENRD